MPYHSLYFYTKSDTKCFSVELNRVLRKAVVMKNSSSNFLKLSEVIQILNLSKSTIQRIKNPSSISFDPEFPMPIRFSARNLRWRREQIEIWIKSKERIVDD